LVAFGRPAPTGAVSFLDISNGNAVVATAPTEAASAPQTMALLGTPFAAGSTPYESFAAAAGKNSAIGPRSFGVAVGDFNSDGIQDLVTAGVGDGLLSVLLGNG
jgi:hypothetical protein